MPRNKSTESLCKDEFAQMSVMTTMLNFKLFVLYALCKLEIDSRNRAALG